MTHTQMTEQELLIELQRLNKKYREDCEPVLRALERIRGFYAEPRLELVECDGGADCAEARQFSWPEPDGAA